MGPKEPNELVKVPFDGGYLYAAKVGDVVWVSIRQVCKELGLTHQSQQAKLRDLPWATVTIIVTVAENGKDYSMLCIDLDGLPMWLSTLHPSKCKPAVRPRLERFQKEAARVLRDHFFGKPAAVVVAPASDPAASVVVAPTSGLTATIQHKTLILLGQLEERFVQNHAMLLSSVGEVKAEVGEVKAEVGEVKAEVRCVGERVDSLEKVMLTVKGSTRVKFGDATRARYASVVCAKYDCRCACCKREVVYDRSAKRMTSKAHVDHFFSVNDNSVENGWLVCHRCNHMLGWPAAPGGKPNVVRDQHRHLFDEFHRALKAHEGEQQQFSFGVVKWGVK